MFKTVLIALALLFVVGCEADDYCPKCKDYFYCDRSLRNINQTTFEDDFNCDKTLNYDKVPEASCYICKCALAIEDHIKYELNAAFTYFAMGAYFAQESINRPGIAKFLFGAASEERSHAILMLEYLNKRGIPLEGKHKSYEFDNDNFNNHKLNKLVGVSYKDALTHALNMELDVTQRIYKVIEKCDKDYHGADVFTNPILDEQHEGVRHLQGAIKVLNNLEEGQELMGTKAEEFKKYAEYIFDMKLLKGEIAAH